MLESTLESRLSRRVRALGGMSIKLAPIIVGTPDRLVLLPGGRMVLVELKTDTGRLSPRQVAWHAEAARREVPVVVLHGAKEMDEWVDGLTGHGGESGSV